LRRIATSRLADISCAAVNISHKAAPKADLAPGPMSTPGPRFWLLARAALIVALTVGCITAVAYDWVSPIRAALALGFLLFCPGLALAEVLEIRDLAQRLAIATGASLALDALLSLLLIYLGAFSIPLAVSILGALTLAALAAGLVRALLHPRRDKAAEPA
jgi:uncharacterized membrane protein